MRYTTKNLNELANWVGFEPMLSQLDQLLTKGLKQPTWPPYNIRQVDETNYVIEMAVAGYTEKQLCVTVEDNILYVKGEASTEKEVGEYLYKGLAERTFSRSFTLADNVVAGDVSLNNGMLKISLTKIIPEEKKPRVLAINSLNTQPQFLAG